MGASKPVCLGDLGVTLCSLSLKPLASVHLTSLLFLLISLFPSFNTHNIVNFAVVSAICLQFLCRSSVFFFFFLCWQSGRIVWTSIKAGSFRSFRMFFNSSSSSIHFLYIHNQGLGAGTYPISHWVRTRPGRLAVPGSNKDTDTHFHSHTQTLSPTLSCF